jgi:hypothetical protein
MRRLVGIARTFPRWTTTICCAGATLLARCRRLTCPSTYHHHRNNSCKGKDLNRWIQEYTLTLHDDYIYQLVEK